MLFTLVDKDTIMDAYALKGMTIYELLIKFLNLNIDTWLSNYEEINIDTYQDIVYELTHINNSAPLDLSQDEYLEFALNQLIKGSITAKFSFGDPSTIDYFTEISTNGLEGRNIYESLIANNLGNSKTFLDVCLENKVSNEEEAATHVKLFVNAFKKQINVYKSNLSKIQNNIHALTEELVINKHSYDQNEELECNIIYNINFFQGKLVEFYEIESIEPFCLFVISKLLYSGILIKKCDNCQDFFVPVDPREVYCDKVHPNGRTCKQMGYENKINSDEIMKEYRRVYKTKNAYKNRNKNIPYIENNFKQWKYAAKNNMELCKSGEITLEEFKEWLNTN